MFFALLVVLLAPNARSVCTPNSPAPQRAFPVLDIGCDRELRYLGSYHSDGKFRPNGLMDELADRSGARDKALRPHEVPPTWNLHGREKSVYNFLPPEHKESRVRERSLLTSWRDDLVTLVYGREKAFLQPRYVASDTLGRIIVGDPAASAVHVLDGEQSFRIVASPHTRLHSIAGVATDRDNNIYVGDPDAELVVVFDPYGHWLRDIGRYDEKEGIFHQLVGIAIDREHNRLYVADQRLDSLLILELGGHLVRRVGGRRQEQSVSFDHILGVSAKRDRVYVIDSDGTRVQVLDLIGRPLHSFPTTLPRRPRALVSLDVDANHNLFIAAEGEPSVHILRSSGEPVARVGTPGDKRGEFAGPCAVWVDENDQLFVSEAGNRRVQVFAISAQETTDALPSTANGSGGSSGGR